MYGVAEGRGERGGEKAWRGGKGDKGLHSRHSWVDNFQLEPSRTILIRTSSVQFLGTYLHDRRDARLISMDRHGSLAKYLDFHPTPYSSTWFLVTISKGGLT